MGLGELCGGNVEYDCLPSDFNSPRLFWYFFLKKVQEILHTFLTNDIIFIYEKI